jgi:hypothetical protein
VDCPGNGLAIYVAPFGPCIKKCGDGLSAVVLRAFHEWQTPLAYRLQVYGFEPIKGLVTDLRRPGLKGRTDPTSAHFMSALEGVSDYLRNPETPGSRTTWRVDISNESGTIVEFGEQLRNAILSASSNDRYA